VFFSHCEIPWPYSNLALTQSFFNLQSYRFVGVAVSIPRIANETWSLQNKKKPKWCIIMPGSKDDTSVYIGRRPTNNYVLAAMVLLNEGKDCIIKARGRAISHAVDIAEVLRNRFMKNVEIKDIKIGTERMTGPDGKDSNVSSIEITIAKKQ
jgi:DNA-binding protein